jgi:hypothetical protein
LVCIVALQQAADFVTPVGGQHASGVAGSDILGKFGGGADRADQETGKQKSEQHAHDDDAAR